MNYGTLLTQNTVYNFFVPNYKTISKLYGNKEEAKYNEVREIVMKYARESYIRERKELTYLRDRELAIN